MTSRGQVPDPLARHAAEILALTLAVVALAPGGSAAAASAPSGRWVYLRGGEVPAAGETLVEVLVVGDVMTGRGMADVPNIFGHVSEALRRADLTFGNLEGVLSAERSPLDSLWLHLPLDTTEMLAEAGFDLLSLANNHALDAGWAGLARTRRLLREAGLEPVEAGASVVRDIDGLRIAFLAWNELGTPEQEPLLEAVRRARAEAEIVVVLVHWGREYQRHSSLPQRELARLLLDAGADVVAGAHPHVVQELRVLEPESASGRTRLVAYSLGNFAFDQGWDDTGHGLALRLLFDAGGLRAAQALPLWTAPRPRWMDLESAAPLLARILPADRLGFDCVEGACEPIDLPDDARSGIFSAGAIDLTGDGLPEVVRRQGEAVEIFEDGRPVWRSPPEWPVRDLALGDPNRDGRYEVMLATYGEAGSQPFVVGYRGGAYRLLWGGSPVRDALLEVDLADVDGDGLEELAVIESAADGSGRYLTVWRWHGWGFSLVWRSAPGEYSDLLVLPGRGGRPDRLSVAANGSSEP